MPMAKAGLMITDSPSPRSVLSATLRTIIRLPGSDLVSVRVATPWLPDSGIATAIRPPFANACDEPCLLALRRVTMVWQHWIKLQFRNRLPDFLCAYRWQRDTPVRIASMTEPSPSAALIAWLTKARCGCGRDSVVRWLRNSPTCGCWIIRAAHWIGTHPVHRAILGRRPAHQPVVWAKRILGGGRFSLPGIPSSVRAGSRRVAFRRSAAAAVLTWERLTLRHSTPTSVLRAASRDRMKTVRPVLDERIRQPLGP